MPRLQKPFSILSVLGRIQDRTLHGLREDVQKQNALLVSPAAGLMQ
jgi:hypothetical protein